MSDRVAQALDEEKIRERIGRNTTALALWVVARVAVDRNASDPIGELFSDYEGYCRQNKAAPLPRKTWIGAMKLAGFETQSGAFHGLKLKSDLN